MKKNKSILLAVLMMCSFMADIQAAKPVKKGNPYIKGIGISFFGEFGQTKPYAAYTGDPRHPDFMEYEKTRTGFGFSILSFGMNNHYILKAFNTDKSLSLNFYPVLGLGFTRGRIFNLTAPLFINYNMGAVATHDSKKELGITVGIGVEYVKAGLISLKENFNLWESGKYHHSGFDAKLTNLLHPAVNFGVRYFSKGGPCKGTKSEIWYDDVRGI